MFFRASCTLAALMAVMMVIPGCGPSGPRKYPVAGEVTFDGKPVADATVTFHSDKTGAVGVELDSDGKFDLQSVGGLEEGDYKVYVNPPELYTQPPQMGGPPTAKPPEPKNIPQKYRQALTTDLSVKVDGPKDDLKFDMKP